MSELPTAIPDGPVEPAAFRAALGRFATGVVVVAAIDGGAPHGLAVNSFTSVSLDPPLVGFYADRSSSTWPPDPSGRRFHCQRAVRRAGARLPNVRPEGGGPVRQPHLDGRRHRPPETGRCPRLAGLHRGERAPCRRPRSRPRPGPRAGDGRGIAAALLRRCLRAPEAGRTSLGRRTRRRPGAGGLRSIARPRSGLAVLRRAGFPPGCAVPLTRGDRGSSCWRRTDCPGSA